MMVVMNRVQLDFASHLLVTILPFFFITPSFSYLFTWVILQWLGLCSRWDAPPFFRAGSSALFRPHTPNRSRSGLLTLEPVVLRTRRVEDQQRRSIWLSARARHCFVAYRSAFVAALGSRPVDPISLVEPSL